MSNVYGYARTSREGLKLSNQLRQLTAAGVDRANVFIDRGVSGQLDPDKRPQFGMLQRTLQDGDTLIVAAFDRLSRVMKHQGRIFRDMARANIHLRSLADREQALSRYTELPPEDLMTETIRDVLITLTGYQAEMELEALSNRTRQGQARARAEGKHIGRPQPAPARVTLARGLFLAGASKRSIAKQIGVSEATVRAWVKETT